MPMSDAAFSIRQGAHAGEILMSGRLDASQCDAALAFLNAVKQPEVIDLAGLDYIASAGLRVILMTVKRCKAQGSGVRLINVCAPIYDIFHYAGFDQILDISRAAN
jgi:anti-anti-sigma factor